MSVVGAILERLRAQGPAEVVWEVERAQGCSGDELLGRIGAVRGLLRARGVGPGARVALLGANTAAWIAADLAALAEGAVVVPLDPRLSSDGLGAQVRDAEPALLLADDPSRAPDGVACAALETAGQGEGVGDAAWEPSSDAPATIVYTSGSTGRPRGAVLGHGGLGFMLAQTTPRLAQLTGREAGEERTCHYLPLCYAGSRVLLLSALLRGARVALVADPARLSDALAAAAPDYLLNVPLVLERVMAGARRGIAARGRAAAGLLARAEVAWARREDGRSRTGDRVWIALFRATLGRAVRRRFGPRLRGLICGSAPLAEGTQRFFRLLGVEVYQGYGLTETTALCTLDVEGAVRPGWVGPALPGVELRRSAAGELETRGPHVFLGYWRDPAASAALLTDDGWLRTGDLGEVDAAGRWRILGRISAQVALMSGHKVEPEPLEAALAARLPAGAQVLLFGQGRPGLVAVVAGEVEEPALRAAVAAENALRPPHQRVREVVRAEEAFTPENGLLTANLKPRRREVAARHAAALEAAWARMGAAVVGAP